MRRALVLLPLLLAFGGPAAAQSRQPATSAETDRARLGHACTPFACRPDPGSPTSHVLGFAAGSLAAGWISRRRRTRHH